jgi:hypothetical protein
MTIISDLAATNDIAMAVAGALEQLLGEDVILAVGMPRQDAPGADSVPDGAVRAVAMPFVDGIGGEIALIVRADFALAIPVVRVSAFAIIGDAIVATQPPTSRIKSAIARLKNRKSGDRS